MESAHTSVDILGLHFSDVEVPYLMAAFNDSRDALKTQQAILNPEKGYLNNPQRIHRDFLEDCFRAKCRGAMEFEKPDCRWCAEWKKFLLGEPADAGILKMRTSTDWAARYVSPVRTTDPCRLKPSQQPH